MPHVVTQSCCSDASCVVACPVNCIHPAPGEPGFAKAEMLYVDADSCVDCGACVSACPVDAIKPHTKLTEAELPFLELNSSYYLAEPHSERTPIALVPRREDLGRNDEVRVAVVGAGPAGLYAADELLKHRGVRVDVYDRLPTPYGLVRAGVAPDHQRTKQVTELFAAIEGEAGFRYRLNVEVGEHISHDDLRRHYHAVIHAVGASSDRRLRVAGEDLPGSLSATDLVGWYNGHPDHVGHDVPLDHERVVVVGNGNVALDVARILSADPASLAVTDIAAPALERLRDSSVREVVVMGRRGPVEAAFTLPELIGLAGLRDIDVVVDNGGEPIAVDSAKTRLVAELASRTPVPGRRRIVLRFRTAPVRILGQASVTGVEVERTDLGRDEQGVVRAVPTGETEVIDCGMVLRSVGYRGEPVAELPFDEVSGTVPNTQGRVRPGVYVAGWIKRGPTGFIGTNKSCSEETVRALLDDLRGGRLPEPVHGERHLETVLRRGQPDVVDREGWQAVDEAERARGRAAGRVRAKFVDPSAAVEVALDARARKRTRSRGRRTA